MKFLFVHQNFPGQYLHLARHLSSIPGNEIVFITQRENASLPGIRNIVYKPQRQITPGVHHYLFDTESGILNAQEVARAALSLRDSGFVPDVMLGHNGWGEIWYLKDVFPHTPLIGYFEFFYLYRGADVGFNPNDPDIFDTAPRIRTKNLGNLIGLDAVDIGQTATSWQKSLYPERYRQKLHAVHEGINTDLVAPNATVRLPLPGSGLEFTRDDEVVTYVARNLEPYRGFPSFMRSLPELLRKRPDAHIIIVGGDDVSYGHHLPEGKTHKQIMLDELGSSIDSKRVHFLGKVPYTLYLKILQLSRVHVYLTYPFVLSWSMMEAMSAGCLIVASKTQPVEEIILDGENGLMVDFFSHGEIATRVAEALEAGPNGYSDIRTNARNTVIRNYDLAKVCLPAQLGLIETALNCR